MSELNAVDPKAPGETKLYTMDWSAELASGDTVATTAWALSSTEITNVVDAIVSGSLKTSIKVSGGVEGREYYLTNTITTTVSGETLKRTGVLKIRTEGVNA